MNTPTIREVMTDPALFGDQFGGESFKPWVALLSAFHALTLNSTERDTFEAITGRTDSPQEACEELWLVIGRRGGKSQCAALLAVYYACFIDYRDRLSPGEIATVRVMAADRPQARTVMRYIGGLLAENAMLKQTIINQGRESIELNNSCIIEVGTASFRSTRGYTYAAVIADEIAFWRSDDSANPDTEILQAVRPGLATLEGKLICLSSPYAKRGELWRTYSKYFGKEGRILVAQAPSMTMNPTLPQRVIDDAMERDASAARAEYLAEFRDDLEAFISREIVEAAVRQGPLENPIQNSKYFAFVDPAGGGRDEFCLAIGHKDGDRAIVDCLRARKGTPANIAAEYAELLKQYGLRVVTGDRYAGSWPSDEFQRHGINYRQAKKPKSDLYLDLLPALNSGRVELPPCEKLVNQISGLERRTSRSGRDSIDHPPNGSDDRANVVAGLVSQLSGNDQPTAVFGTYSIGAGDDHIERGYRMNKSHSPPNPLFGRQSISGGKKETKRYFLSNGETATIEE